MHAGDGLYKEKYRLFINYTAQLYLSQRGAGSHQARLRERNDDDGSHVYEITQLYQGL